MLAITLHRPWELAMTPPGPKLVENRSWAPPPGLIGQRIALHAGQKFDFKAAARIGERWPGLDVTKSKPGVIVCVATLAEAHEREACLSRADTDPCGTCETPWSFGPWCWGLTDRVALPEPIPARGFQKLWALTREDERRVLAQVLAAPVAS